MNVEGRLGPFVTVARVAVTRVDEPVRKQQLEADDSERNTPARRDRLTSELAGDCVPS